MSVFPNHNIRLELGNDYNKSSVSTITLTKVGVFLTRQYGYSGVAKDNIMPSDLAKICHTIEHSAVKLAATILFVAWLVAAVWHELARIFTSLTGP